MAACSPRLKADLHCHTLGQLQWASCKEISGIYIALALSTLELFFRSSRSLSLVQSIVVTD